MQTLCSFILVHVHAVDPCESGPCLNGGTCHAIYALTAAGFHCSCRDGYGGVLCKLKKKTATQTTTREFNDNQMLWSYSSLINIWYTAPDVKENIAVAESNSVVVVGGALGGVLVLLLTMAAIMILIIVYLGYQLRQVHKYRIVQNGEGITKLSCRIVHAS